MYVIDYLSTKSDDFFLVLVIPVGSVNESKAKSGISHFLEHLLFINKQDILKQYSIYNAMTTSDFTVYFVKCKLSNAMIITKTMLNIVCEFDVNHLNTAEFEREKQVVIEEMIAVQKNNNYDSENYSLKELIEGTPFNNSVIGSLKTLENIGPKDIQEHYETMYKDIFVTFCCKNKLLIRPKIEKELQNSRFSVNKKVTTLKQYLHNRKPKKPNKIVIKLKITNDIQKTVINIGFKPCENLDTKHSFLRFIIQELIKERLREEHGYIYSSKVKHMFNFFDIHLATFHGINDCEYIVNCLSEILKDSVKYLDDKEWQSKYKKHEKLTKTKFDKVKQKAIEILRKHHPTNISIKEKKDNRFLVMTIFTPQKINLKTKNAIKNIQNFMKNLKCF